jgi:hypothetical protein
MAAFFIFLLLSCNNDQLTLEGIRYTPEYFLNSIVWGENETAIKMKNEYLLETGVIDTTSETPPIKVAFIAMQNKTIQLNFQKQDLSSNKIIETYIGNDYTLILTKNKKINSNDDYKALVVVSKSGLTAEYELIGKNGLQ